MQATIQYNDFINNLDTAQRAAATISENAVIAAGAGSGKTKVLSSRYIFLVVEKKYTVDQILTLTFTQKAAVEMRTRIYRDLCSIDDPAARQAVKDFHKAQISTIDSFCSAIAKQGCRQFGISPDYTLDDDKALSLAKKSALPFVLEHRNSPSIKNFLRKFSATDTAELFLAESVHYGASLSRPLNVYRDAKKQGTEVAKVWKKYTDEITTVMTDIEQLGKPKDATATQIVLVDNAAKILGLGSLPLLFDDASGQFGSFSGTALANGARYAELLLNFKIESKNYAAIKPIKNNAVLKDEIKNVREKIIPLAISLFQYAESRPIIEDAFTVLDLFQTTYIAEKRAAGVLTFKDVAQLAVDVLKKDPSLRNSYKKQYKAIMIDEFQDDNELQRDLLFLLAEQEAYHDVILHDQSPDSTHLCGDKLFFVGDEKQSIYRFRGADVSVFRHLTVDIAAESVSAMPVLSTNYRTQTKLIDIFNLVFPDVFLSALQCPNGLPSYEASFVPIQPFQNAAGIDPHIELLAVNSILVSANDPSLLTGVEVEAATVAQRISEIVTSGVLIFDRDAKKTRPAGWGDIAILFKSKTSQHHFEHYLRYYNVPYATENQRGLFSDAPVNDMYNIMRLAVYPRDQLAYATLLRSPFVRLDDNDLAIVLSAGMQNKVVTPLSTCVQNSNADNSSDIAQNNKVSDSFDNERNKEEADSADNERKKEKTDSADTQDSAGDDFPDIVHNSGVVTSAVGTQNNGAVAPFDTSIDALLSSDGAARFAAGRKIFKALSEMIDRKPIAEIVTWLWYNTGYRYEIVTNPHVRMYGELYDYFFELARQSDLLHISTAQFLDVIAEMMENPGSANDIDIPVERPAGVTLMTIHKSKGLEFPIVFIVECTSKRSFERNIQPVYQMDDFGITVNILKPGTKRMQSVSSENYFFAQGREEDMLKGEAELRRLLYVAMTRAEHMVVISGGVALDSEDKQLVNFDATVYENALETADKTLADKRIHPGNFFDALFFAFSKNPQVIQSKEIKPLLRASFASASAVNTVSLYPLANVEQMYRNIPCAVYPPMPLLTVAASHVHQLECPVAALPQTPPAAANTTAYNDPDPIDTIIEGTGLTAADFGTAVHGAIEAGIKKAPFVLPHEIRARVDDKSANRITRESLVFAKRFFDSKIASYLAHAESIKSEYALKTCGTVNGQKVVISGQIDLLFTTSDKCVYVVDFKTDRVENPAVHVRQIEIYKKAAADLYPGYTVKGVLFYVRTGQTKEI